MTASAKKPSFAATAIIALLAASALLMWLPALHVPLWGDDYVFLLQARTANAAGLPWWSDFLPSSPVRFWRPLSQEGYWRLMLALTGGNAVALHAGNFLLHLLASLAVGLLAWRTALACQWPRASRIGVLAGVIHGGLAMHLLPLHWVAAANNSMLVLFSSLALAAWIDAPCRDGLRRVLLLVAVPPLLALALLCKESAVLTPLLMVVLGLFCGRQRWRVGEIATLAACLLLVAIWLVLDRRFTADTDASYTLELGANVLRNGVSFIAWMLNVPREAIRLAMTGSLLPALAWSALAALPMLAACTLAVRGQQHTLSPRQWLGVAVFAGLAYGPYFLFSWNSYAYYAAVAAILPAIVLARLGAAHPRLWLIAALLALSAWSAVSGTRHVSQPGLIARAQWGEHLLRQLEQQPPEAPLWVATGDEQRFYAIGQAGLAWRLGIAPSAIHPVRHCPAKAARCLVIDDHGKWHWRDATGTAGTATKQQP